VSGPQPTERLIWAQLGGDDGAVIRQTQDLGDFGRQHARDLIGRAPPNGAQRPATMAERPAYEPSTTSLNLLGRGSYHRPRHPGQVAHMVNCSLLADGQTGPDRLRWRPRPRHRSPRRSLPTRVGARPGRRPPRSPSGRRPALRAWSPAAPSRRQGTKRYGLWEKMDPGCVSRVLSTA
jgi:hypothetical protein